MFKSYHHLSDQKLSTRLLYGRTGSAYTYTGIVDTIGYRMYGRYFDSLATDAGSLEVSGNWESRESCVCCGTDEYYYCLSCDCYEYQVDPISASFKTTATGGYFDPATNSGFVEMSVARGLSAINETFDKPTVIGDCATYNIIDVTIDSDETQYGIKKDGTLWAWGKNDYGQVGDGTIIIRYSPVQIGSDTNWSDISGGCKFVTAIKTDGTIWAWGANSYGQLGDGTTTNRSSPVQIGIGATWKSINSSLQNSIHAIQTNGTLWGCGCGDYGAIGNGMTTNYSSLIQIGSNTDWASISHGFSSAFAIKSDGTLWGWGYNAFYQLGDGTIINKSSPIQLGSDNNWKCVAAPNNYVSLGVATGLKTNGTLWGWGKWSTSVATQIGSSSFYMNLPKLLHTWMSNPHLGLPVITNDGNVVICNLSTTNIVLYSGGSAVKVIVPSMYNAYIIKNVL